ncbi:hypothetical protein EV368DRAFT_83441 [Lentinula lateritia]|nr:hypothetical protein EV368DRAFT_83441 [Lentinula lateritia]
MANHRFQHLLSSPGLPPSSFSQHSSRPPLQNTGHYSLPSLHHSMQNAYFPRISTDLPYSAPQSRTELRQIPTQPFTRNPEAYNQPTSHAGFSSSYTRPTFHTGFPSSQVGSSPRRGTPLRDNDHQPLPSLSQRFRSVDNGHYTSRSFPLGLNAPCHSDSPVATGQQGHSDSSQHGALQWQKTVVCSNVDASKLHAPTPTLLSRPSSPIPTQNSGRSYGPVHDHRVVSILNSDVHPSATFSIPRPPPNPFPSCEPSSPTLAPSAGPYPSVNDPTSTPPSSSGPVLGSRSPVHDTPPALTDTASSQLSSHRAICDPSPSTNGSLPSPVTSVLSGLNSTPASIGQAEQAHCPIVALGVSEKSLAKATSALKAKLLNEAISQLQIEHEEKVMDLANTHGVTVSRVKKLAGTSKHHQKRRVNSAQDAILHAKSKEMNEGRRYKAKIGEI